MRVIDEEGHTLENIIEIYRWKADNEEDKGHGYHIASLPLDEIPCIVMQLEMTKQKLMRDYGLVPSPDPEPVVNVKNCVTSCPNPESAVKEKVKPRNKRMEKFNSTNKELMEKLLGERAVEEIGILACWDRFNDAKEKLKEAEYHLVLAINDTERHSPVKIKIDIWKNCLSKDKDNKYINDIIRRKIDKIK